MRPDFYRRKSCGLISSFKLTASSVGGRGRRSLGIAYRPTPKARVQATVLRGRRVVRRYKASTRLGRPTHRPRLPARALERGSYTVVVQAKAGNASSTVRLVSRRL